MTFSSSERVVSVGGIGPHLVLVHVFFSVQSTGLGGRIAKARRRKRVGESCLSRTIVLLSQPMPRQTETVKHSVSEYVKGMFRIDGMEFPMDGPGTGL